MPLEAQPTPARRDPVESGAILTDAERARIRAEEIYRATMREEVTVPKKGIAKVSAFLNSPFGLLFLSSVVLSGLTFIYTGYQEAKEKTKVRQQEIVKLTDEITFRERALDDALKIVERESKSFVNMPDTVPKPTRQRDVNGYRLECKEVAATVRAGGLISPPGDLPRP
jgi:hypothetical protein